MIENNKGEINMIDINKIEIKYMLKITEDQLWDFHVRNDICEVGHRRKSI